jgi:predicted metalloendopeptidase
MASAKKMFLFNSYRQFAENPSTAKIPKMQAFYEFLGLSPAVVNAWYFSVTNSINFAYAFLNPPYYRLDFPQAVNFGGQGSVAGHELGHAFDDSGVQFGAEVSEKFLLFYIEIL